MSGLDVKTWKLWDWIGAVSLLIAAIIPVLNTVLKEAPHLTSRVPGLLGSSLWTYGPLVLLVIVGISVVVSSKAKPMNSLEAVIASPVALEKFRFTGHSMFQLFAQNFTVDLTAQLPYVETRFIVVNFLPRPITLTPAKFSLQIYGAPALEAIPLSQEDFVLSPYEGYVVTFRRNLNDAERHNLPWRAGRVSASYQLLAKAQDEGRTLSYGPVSAMAIDGWVAV